MTNRNLTILVLALLALALAGPLACGQMIMPKYDPSMTLDPASPAAGATAKITTHVSYFYFQQGKDPSARDVYVKYSISTPSGEVSLPSATEGYTNEQGIQTAEFTAPSTPGDYKLNVYAYEVPGGDILGQGAAYFTVTQAAATPVPVVATPVPTPAIVRPTVAPTVVAPARGGLDLGSNIQLLLIIGAVIVVAILLLIFVLAVLAFLWTRRKLVVAAAKASAPADGQSAIPVAVKFTNGLGLARRMKEDTAVELAATAGTIGNAVIARGSEAAETQLKTSREFGTVTVTAKAGKKTATTRVRFTADGARIGFVMVPDSLPADGTASPIGVRVVDAGGNVLAPLEDLAVDLKATLGKVTGRTTIRAKALEASAEYNAGTVPGGATITATAGALKGEVKLAVKEKPGRYCMHCGAPVEMEAASCPKCGLTPPSGTDAKQCPGCSTVIPEAAKFCHRCGLAQPEPAKAVDPEAVKK